MAWRGVTRLACANVRWGEGPEGRGRWGKVFILSTVLDIMFKNFEYDTSVSGTAPLKSSAAKKVIEQLRTQYPLLAEKGVLEDMFGANVKKTPLKVVAVHGHIQLLLAQSQEAVFYNFRNGPYMPSMRTLYKYPGIMKSVRVDRGAIKYILRGADVMCPGLTSEGGELPDENYPAGTPVAIFAEGKSLPLGVGLLKLSTDQIKSENTGVAIYDIHHIDDGLWKNPDYD